jgi:hypothetical protein
VLQEALQPNLAVVSDTVVSLFGANRPGKLFRLQAESSAYGFAGRRLHLPVPRVLKRAGTVFRLGEPAGNVIRPVMKERMGVFQWPSTVQSGVQGARGYIRTHLT